MLRHDPERVADQPVADRCTPRPAGAPSDGLEQRAAGRNDAELEQQLDRWVQHTSLQRADHAELHDLHDISPALARERRCERPPRPSTALRPIAVCGYRCRHVLGPPHTSAAEHRTVRLTPSDQEKLLLSMAGLLARDRRARGVKLNLPEATALLCCWVIERARDGDASVAQLMADGRGVLTRADVMEGVAELLSEVQVEATFPDGRKLVTLHRPIP
jgi:urease gamma subunit